MARAVADAPAARKSRRRMESPVPADRRRGLEIPCPAVTRRRLRVYTREGGVRSLSGRSIRLTRCFSLFPDRPEPSLSHRIRTPLGAGWGLGDQRLPRVL